MVEKDLVDLARRQHNAAALFEDAADLFEAAAADGAPIRAIDLAAGDAAAD